jgi:hypothetical protein
MVLLLAPACSPQSSSFEPRPIHKTVPPVCASSSTDENPCGTSAQTNTINEMDETSETTENASKSTNFSPNDTKDTTPQKSDQTSPSSTAPTSSDDEDATAGESNQSGNDTKDISSTNETDVSSDETDLTRSDDSGTDSVELDNEIPVDTVISTGVGTWRKHSEVSISPKTWHCQTSADLLSIWTAQNCVIIQNGYYQTAIVVRNRSSSPSPMSAATRNSETGEGFECAQANISANDYWVCFGKTLIREESVARITADGELISNGESYPIPASTVEFSL